MKPLFLKMLPASLVVVVLAVVVPACEANRGMGEKITLGVATQPLSAPVYVAYEKGFFARRGLQVTLLHFQVEKNALDSVLSGKSQFGTVAETSVMFAALRDMRVLILATIADSHSYLKIVARKDRNIAGPQDLRGKIIGILPESNAPYFLDAYLTFNGIAIDQVRTVPLKAEDLTDALAEGRIDAAVSWNPLFARQQKMLGADGITLEEKMIYHIYWNLVANPEYLKGHHETAEKLLRALLDAQSYMESSPVDAREIIARYAGENFNLNDYNFDLRLGQSLLLELEDQARWAINKKLSDKKKIPNFLNLMYVQGMEAVEPGSATVVHK